eukprot:scaffold76399_cov21-Phaeocystis_antarctica.AAC.1
MRLVEEHARHRGLDKSDQCAKPATSVDSALTKDDSPILKGDSPTWRPLGAHWPPTGRPLALFTRRLDFLLAGGRLGPFPKGD